MDWPKNVLTKVGHDRCVQEVGVLSVSEVAVLRKHLQVELLKEEDKE